MSAFCVPDIFHLTQHVELSEIRKCKVVPEFDKCDPERLPKSRIFFTKSLVNNHVTSFRPGLQNMFRLNVIAAREVLVSELASASMSACAKDA